MSNKTDPCDKHCNGRWHTHCGNQLCCWGPAGKRTSCPQYVNGRSQPISVTDKAVRQLIRLSKTLLKRYSSDRNLLVRLLQAEQRYLRSK